MNLKLNLTVFTTFFTCKAVSITRDSQIFELMYNKFLSLDKYLRSVLKSVLFVQKKDWSDKIKLIPYSRFVQSFLQI